MNALSGPFQRPIVQIGYLVDDIEKWVDRWATRNGAGPFFLYEHFKPAWVTRDGEAMAWDHSAAFGQWGRIQVEFIKSHSISPALAEQFGHHRTGLHHLTWFADDVDAESKRLADHGWGEVMQIEMNTGTRSAFIDSRAELGHLIEIYPGRELVQAHYQAIERASVGWDGTRPLRSWGERPVEGIDPSVYDR